MKGKLFIFFVFTLFFLYCFAVFETDFHGPDDPIYFAYTTSIVEEGDLNVVNNIVLSDDYYFPSKKINVTKTYNLPDFHNHGGVILWAPFYAYGKFMRNFAAKLNIEYSNKSITALVMSLSSLIFGFLTLILTYLFCKTFFSQKIALFSTAIMLFGTPFFYFLLYEVGNAQMLASLLSVLSIWVVSYIIRTKKLHWFIYGLFFGICITVKIDIWFQIFFIIFLFIVLVRSKQTTWKNGGFFLMGLLPACTLKIINDYIKYGTFHMGEFGLLNLKGSFLLEMLFSTYRGYFYTSPVLYICLLGFIFALVGVLKGIKSKEKIESLNEKGSADFFILLLSLYLFTKIFIISHDFAWGGGTPGARTLLTEIPLFVLLFARGLDRQNILVRRFFLSLSIIFVLWNFLAISEYMSGADFRYLAQTPVWSERVKGIRNIIPVLFDVKDLRIKLIFCFFPILATLSIVFYLIFSSKNILPSTWLRRSRGINNNNFKTFALLSVYLVVAYTAVTFLNLQNNKANVERLKTKGFFKDAKILSEHEFEKNENVGSMDEMIEYFTLKGEFERVGEIKRAKKRMYEQDN